MTTSLVRRRTGVLLGSVILLAITLRTMGRLLPGAPLRLGPFLIGAAMTVLLWPMTSEHRQNRNQL